MELYLQNNKWNLIKKDSKKMSKHLGKASQQVIRIMMDGVKGGKYTAMEQN